MPTAGTPGADPATPPSVRLDGLAVEDIALPGRALEPAFSPALTRYTLRVQPDITCVRVTPLAPAGARVVVNGVPVERGASVTLSFGAGREDYDTDLAFGIRVEARGGDARSVYTVTVLRPSDRALRARFRVGTFADGETGLSLPYALYLPPGYETAGAWPLVVAMHGSTQRAQGTDMVLKYYRHATAFAEDSERGHNPCLVLAPHCATADDNENWTSLMRWRHGLEGSPFRPMAPLGAAWRLLLRVLAGYGVDRRRVYLTGLSAGGFAAWALAARHPEVFAAVAPCCGGLDPALAGALKGLPVWFFHAEDDRQVDYRRFGQGTARALDAAGVPYCRTVYSAGRVFAPSPHFSWVPMYADGGFRDWLFRQRKD